MALLRLIGNLFMLAVSVGEEHDRYQADQSAREFFRNQNEIYDYHRLGIQHPTDYPRH
ncbi:hypothetical protein ACIOHC_36380 [Streptomyces sp. NPDC088252]|uniref:hypothetical protein n=1 Tax=Streptomyces sp. NPDC088252 TaxID=3365845 RepID=UPI00381F0AE7